jgi:hypothetical protein
MDNEGIRIVREWFEEMTSGSIRLYDEDAQDLFKQLKNRESSPPEHKPKDNERRHR